MRALVTTTAVAVVAAFALPVHGCASAARRRTEPSRLAPHGHETIARERRGHLAREAAGGTPLLAEYFVRYEAASGVLHVEARFARPPGARFGVDRGAEPFVEDLEAAALDGAGAWAPAARQGSSFVVERCAATACKLRYRYALRDAARRIDDLDVAIEDGDLVEAPPSTWLAAPTDAGGGRVRFRVTCSAGTRFVTGVFRSTEDPTSWDITLDDLVTAPYSAFGPLRVVAVREGDAAIDLAVASGSLAASDADLARWTKDSARAVASYFGRFPMREALVVVVPGRGAWVGGARTLSGGGGSIFAWLGAKATKTALASDWVLVHEMTHLAFPSVPRSQDWAEEGLATYVEPLARARAGLLSAEDAWRGLVEGLPHGLPRAGDQGLDRTHTWGRLYWGGALFYLLADVELRKRSGNKLGLEHALRGVLAAGGSNAVRWSLEDAFAAGDRATGFGVLRELHDAMGTSPHPVDLDALFRSLGVRVVGRSIVFDDGAPLAHIRRALTTPS